MRIDELNTMVVLVFALYLFCKKSLAKKLRIPAYAVQRICEFLTPQIPLNINLGVQNLHRAENSWSPIYPPNVVFLSAPGANRQGGGGSYQTPGRPRYGKGPGRARVKWLK